MNTRYYLPDPKDMPKEIFKTKFFRALFYIPGIKFEVSNSDSDFPVIPDEYVADGIDRGNVTRCSTIHCHVTPERCLYLSYGKCHSKSWFISLKCRRSIPRDRSIDIRRFDDCDFSSDFAKRIAKYLLGPEWETLLDNSTYNIQKNRFIHNYHLKKLLIESIECLSIVKYVLVGKLMELEFDETTHIYVV